MRKQENHCDRITRVNEEIAKDDITVIAPFFSIIYVSDYNDRDSNVVIPLHTLVLGYKANRIRVEKSEDLRAP